MQVCKWDITETISEKVVFRTKWLRKPKQLAETINTITWECRFTDNH